MRERLPPDQIGAQGQLQEWLEDRDADVVEIHHRHVSRGGLSLNIAWREGRLSECRLQARVAGRWRIRLGEQQVPVTLRAGQSTTLSLREGKLVLLTT